MRCNTGEVTASFSEVGELLHPPSSRCALRLPLALRTRRTRCFRENKKPRLIFRRVLVCRCLQISGNTSSGDGDDVVDRPRLRVGNTNLPP